MRSDFGPTAAESTHALLILAPCTFALWSLGPGAIGCARCPCLSHQHVWWTAAVGPPGAVVGLVPLNLPVINYHAVQGDWCQFTLHSCVEPREKSKVKRISVKTCLTTRW